MKSVKYASLSALTLAVLLLVWGVGIEPRLIDVEKEVAVIPRLPPEWHGRQVAVISDFQIGMWLGNTGTIRRIVARLVDARPALVLITGDFVYHPSEDERADVEQEEFRAYGDELDTAARIVQPLVAAGIPVYTVLGNHDYGMPWPTSVKNDLLAGDLRESLEAVGVRVLRNEAVPLAAPGGASGGVPRGAPPPLYLIGIGPHYVDGRPERDAVMRALQQVPEESSRIVMMHNPDSFAIFPADTAPLAVAGHTHGGQVRVPFTPDWSMMNWLTDDEITTDGWIDGFGQPGNRLYVNRGIGFSVVPVRIHCLPEITLFTLRAAS